MERDWRCKGNAQGWTVRPQWPEPACAEAGGRMRRSLIATAIRWSDAALAALLAVAMLALVVVNFANVVARYVFSAPWLAADEAMTFTMVWGVFVGAGLVSLRGGHLAMDLVSGALPRRLRAALRLAGAAWLVLVLGFVALQSADFLDTISMIGMTSMAAGIPMWVPHLAIPVGFGLMVAATLLRLFAPEEAEPPA
jgi:TRAP-type C4-dicarboxylate transport system permease small subunit